MVRPVDEPGLLDEPLLDAIEAARMLKVPRSTLYELMRSRVSPTSGSGDGGFASREPIWRAGWGRTATAAN